MRTFYIFKINNMFQTFYNDKANILLIKEYLIIMLCLNIEMIYIILKQIMFIL